MRKDIGTDSEIICELERGTEVEYTGEKTSTKVDGHYWAKVTLQEGKEWKTGWVAAEYLGTADPSGKVKRSVPVAEHNVHYVVPKGKLHNEIGDIFIDLITGWAGDISETTPTDDPPDPNAPKEDEMFYHSMAEAENASSPQMANEYWKRYLEGKK